MDNEMTINRYWLLKTQMLHIHVKIRRVIHILYEHYPFTKKQYQ